MASNCLPIITILSDSSEPSEPSRQSRPAQKTTKRPSSKILPLSQDAYCNVKSDTVTQLEYAKAIKFYSKQTIRDTLHPGSVFEDLALFLSKGARSLNELEGKDGSEPLWNQIPFCTRSARLLNTVFIPILIHRNVLKS